MLSIIFASVLLKNSSLGPGPQDNIAARSFVYHVYYYRFFIHNGRLIIHVFVRRTPTDVVCSHGSRHHIHDVIKKNTIVLL